MIRQTTTLRVHHEGTRSIIYADRGSHLRDSVEVRHGADATRTARDLHSAAAVLRERVAAICHVLRDAAPFMDQRNIRVRRHDRRLLNVTYVSPDGECVVAVRCDDREGDTRRLRRRLTTAITTLLDRHHAVEVQLEDHGLRPAIVIDQAGDGQFVTSVDGREFRDAGLEGLVRRASDYAARQGINIASVIADVGESIDYLRLIQSLFRRRPAAGGHGRSDGDTDSFAD